MRKLQVKDPQVGKNLRLLKQMVDHQIAKQKKFLEAKVFTLFVNRRTGRFETNEKLAVDKSEWEAVPLKIAHRKDADVPFAFDQPFPLLDFHEKALTVIGETFQLMNDSVQQPEEASEIEVDFSEALSGDALINAAFFDLDRYEIEDVLEGHPVGTFLFRKDDYTKMFEEELRLEKQHALHCLTLTFVEPNRKITERTIVRDGERWFFYDDNPDLDEESYPSVDALLESMGSLLTAPLLVG